MSAPPRQAVALAIPNPGHPACFLAVRRPPNDPELPGVWGLPATSLRPGETPQEAAARIGREKLGGEVHVGRLLAQGQQERPQGVLHMTLYEAHLTGEGPVLPPPEDAPPGVTRYTAWRWAPGSLFQEGAQRGSLCCQLLLEALGQRGGHAGGNRATRR